MRQMVRWRRLNLLDDVTRLGQFDLILCRGLLGQMAPEAQDQVLTSLRHALSPNGRLVLGLKETAGPRMSAVASKLGLYAPSPPARSAA
jgi:chemotaxis protein methyltransferase CheR